MRLIQSRPTPETGGRPDRQTTYHSITAHCRASRAKKKKTEFEPSIHHAEDQVIKCLTYIRQLKNSLKIRTEVC